MTEQTIQLPDGRILSYALYGAADGLPVLYFHGTPSSRLEVCMLGEYGIDAEQTLARLGLRLISVDRPGMGLSSYNPNAGLLSFAGDISFLVQSLKIFEASLLCWSGGGPYALAAAWQHLSIIKGLFILCGFSRRFIPEVVQQMKLNRLFFNTARYLPTFLELTMNVIRKGNSRHSLPQWLTGLPLVDYELLKKPLQLQTIARHTFQEACRLGARGPVQEAQLYFKDFGFSLSDIQQPVHFWWGTEDRIVIRLHTRSVEEEIKKSVIHYKEKEGHLSVYVRYFEEALQTIASSSQF
jgi:pimeloyl-ACP methyl ester carboxylesterase